jgi:hypothetical protein
MAPWLGPNRNCRDQEEVQDINIFNLQPCGKLPQKEVWHAFLPLKEGYMNRIVIFLCAAVLIFVTVGGVSAALVDQGNGTIYDNNVGGKYWYKDLSTFVGYDYAETIDLIEAIPGTNFHLATAEEMTALWLYEASDIGNAFTQSGEYPSSFGTTHYHTWGGRYESTEGADPNSHYFSEVRQRQDNFNWDKGPLETYDIPDNQESSWYGAWVASDTALVPIPSAILLLGSGLIGIIGIRRKFRN